LSTRLEEDTAAADPLIARWERLGDRGAHVIRSHRRPTVWLRRHTLAVVGMLAATVTLAASGALSGAEPQVEVPLAGADIPLGTTSALESIEPPQVKATQPTPRREAEMRSSRAQRAEAPARWVKPLSVMKATSCYGSRGGRQHSGVDLDGDTGDVVRSVGTGTVVQAGYRYSNAGLTVVVDHGDTLTLYAHLSRAVVKVGQRIAAGVRLGAVGETGNATGPHLHLGVARTGTLGRLWGSLVNPVPWLEARGVPVPGC
jgi:murein DD-endopeptidase MepM/ murein hydrolase activator NlpD